MKITLKNALILSIALLISIFLNFVFTGNSFAATGPVSASLTANNQSINKGEKVTLNWNSTNADSCVAYSKIQSPWFGVRAVSGNESITPTETATYYITCSNNGGYSGNAQTTVTVGEFQSSNVSVNLSANPESIFRGESTTLIWSSTNAVSCEASGYWSGLKPTSGSERVSPSSTVYYTLRCNNSRGDYTSDTQSIFVNPAAPLPMVTIAPRPVPTQIIPLPTIRPTTPVAKIIKLPAPTNLKPNNEQLAGDAKEVTLSWDAVKGAKFYAVRMDLQVKTDARDEKNNCPDNPHYLCVDKLDSTSIKVKVEPGQTYNWWVHAVDANGVLGSPAFARFSVKAQEARISSNFFANIFSGTGSILIGLIILAFILGYSWGKKRGSDEAKFAQGVRTSPLKI